MLITVLINDLAFSFLQYFCTAVNCGVPDLVNANFNVQTGTEYLDRAVIACNDGYETNSTSSMEVECLSTGNWSNTDDCVGRCQQVDLHTIIHSFIRCRKFTRKLCQSTRLGTENVSGLLQKLLVHISM